MSASASAMGRVAVLIPCFNEEAAVAAVVQGMRAALPEAMIFVYDNGSTDRTVERARGAGAVVRHEPARGKGNVVRRMFADVDADIYILVDGDGTYDATVAPTMVERLLDEQLDMLNAARVEEKVGAYRTGHRVGNAMISGAVAGIFGHGFRDILSGYRAFSRRYVKSFPALATGFEIETELTVHALQLRMPTAELDARYGPRAAGSVSKLHTYRDGFRILGAILRIAKEERPLLFFALLAALLMATSVGLSLPVFEEYRRSGLVPRFPTAILSTGIMILAFLSLTCGFVLDSVTRGRYEMKRLYYLQERPPSRSDFGTPSAPPRR
jgi:glycosyltransferase involved in cell wall biosynthesis